MSEATINPATTEASSGNTSILASKSDDTPWPSALEKKLSIGTTVIRNTTQASSAPWPRTRTPHAVANRSLTPSRSGGRGADAGCATRIVASAALGGGVFGSGTGPDG